MSDLTCRSIPELKVDLENHLNSMGKDQKNRPRGKLLYQCLIALTVAEDTLKECLPVVHDANICGGHCVQLKESIQGLIGPE